MPQEALSIWQVVYQLPKLYNLALFVQVLSHRISQATDQYHIVFNPQLDEILYRGYM
jgi:hypothetical protein